MQHNQADTLHLTKPVPVVLNTDHSFRLAVCWTDVFSHTARTGRHVVSLWALLEFISDHYIALNSQKAIMIPS